MIDMRIILITSIFMMLISGIAIAERNPFARSVQLDPQFAYYLDRSPESIVSEVKAAGFDAVRLMVTQDSAIDTALVKAFQDENMAVWYTTFANGVYNRADLPEGWESWRMILREKAPEDAAVGFTYLCMNNPNYRKWKRQQVNDVLSRIPFDGFEMAEPFWPAFRGPESPLYGCLCDHCRSVFLKIHPEETDIPNFNDEENPSHYAKNPELYNKWVEFRVASVLDFHQYIINKPGGVRENAPKTKVAIWGIAADIPNGVAKLREWEGVDGGLLAKEIKPDLFMLQTDWPDWTNPNLPADYPLRYKLYIEDVRRTSEVPILLQADIGSWENCRRGSAWIEECESAAKKAGMFGVACYEFHLSLDIYEMPPKPLEARLDNGEVVIVFNKRLDKDSASNLQNYSLDQGSVEGIEVDGNIVRLEIEGDPTSVKVKGISDDPTRRFWKNRPPVTMSEEAGLNFDRF